MQEQFLIFIMSADFINVKIIADLAPGHVNKNYPVEWRLI